MLHQQIAQALEALHGDALDFLAAQLAWHWEQAGAWEAALGYQRNAAAVARTRFAYTDVITHLDKVVQLLDLLPTTAQHDVERVDALLELGHLWAAVKGFGAPEVAAAYTQARTRCRHLQQVERASLALRGLWNHLAGYCQWEKASQVQEDLLLLAQQTQNPIHLRRAFWCTGTALFHQGHFREAEIHLQQALALYRDEQQTLDPHDPSDGPAASLYHRLVPTLWMLGYLEQAEANLMEALAIARRSTQPLQLLWTLWFALWLAHDSRQPQRVQRWLDELKTLPLPATLHEGMALRTLSEGWLLAQAGAHERGIELLRKARHLNAQQESRLFLPHQDSWLVEAYLWAGRYEEGLALVREILANADETGNRYWSAELFRLQGELLHRQGHSSVAAVAQLFQRAMDLAKQQGSKMLELRATASMARLWQTAGRAADAQALLDPIYHWFTEGLDRPDLQEAQALLARLY